MFKLTVPLLLLVSCCATANEADKKKICREGHKRYIRNCIEVDKKRLGYVDYKNEQFCEKIARIIYCE